jgi:S-DNA-T family DNA segregation ATPase FtsK/SpoIIIE
MFGLWGDRAGLGGRAIRSVGTAAVGVVQFGLPIALVLMGIAFVGRRRAGDAARPGLGLGLLVVATAAWFHVWTAPWSGIRLVDIQQSGGVIGWMLGQPLRALLSRAGASVVLLAIALFGVLLLSGAELRDVFARAGDRMRAYREREPWEPELEPEENPVAAGVPLLRPRAGARGRDAGGPVADPGEADDFYDIEITGQVRRTAPDDASAAPPAERVVLDLDAADAAVAAAGPAGADSDDAADSDEGAPTRLQIDAPAPKAGAQRAKAAVRKAVPVGSWKLPPSTVLKPGRSMEFDQRAAREGARTLEEALATHGVEADVRQVTIGPTVTRYELKLGQGVKVAKILSLHKDIAYAMASADVRILAPIPGKSRIGIEVPNQRRHIVTLGEILSSADSSRERPLEVAMGMDIDREPVLANLAAAPHVLIAGATGAGKSSCVNSIITSILCRATPDEVRMILIDPKRVELTQYDALPHLLTRVVVNPKKAANALQWAVAEMERRYGLLAEIGVRDVTGYNQAFDRGDFDDEFSEDPATGEQIPRYQRLPFILVVVDELNDLMMVAARDVEASICRLAQMARAVGIHLVIATQRPSVNVITGVIKANIPSRIAFAVSSQMDSRVILDQPGAERLVGQGDMLLALANSSAPRRVQGAWVTEDEVRAVTAHWRRQANPAYVEGVEGDDAAGGFLGDNGDDGDELLEQAMELVVRDQKGSTSMLQRKLSVGFARAGRLMDLLERKGVVGPAEGSKARAVLMTPEELELIKSRAG